MIGYFESRSIFLNTAKSYDKIDHWLLHIHALVFIVAVNISILVFSSRDVYKMG